MNTNRDIIGHLNLPATKHLRLLAFDVKVKHSNLLLKRHNLPLYAHMWYKWQQQGFNLCVTLQTRILLDALLNFDLQTFGQYYRPELKN